MENNRSRNNRWSELSTVKLIRTMQNFKLLWRPNVHQNAKFRRAINFAKVKLVKLIGRPWPDINQKLTTLRYQYNKVKKRAPNDRDWLYYDEMMASVALNEKVLNQKKI